MVLASTQTDLRESLIAQRVLRVQPLSVEICQWMANQKPFSQREQLLFLGSLIESIASANQRNNPYLTICSIASTLPLYQSRSRENSSEQLPLCLNSLCGLVSLSHLRVVIQEEWGELVATAQLQGCLPTEFATEYLTIDFSAWCRQLVEGSLALVGERITKIDPVFIFQADGKDWERNFRFAESMLFAPSEPKVQFQLKKLEANQKSALTTLVERAQAAMSLERFEYTKKEEQSARVEVQDQATLQVNNFMGTRTNSPNSEPSQPRVVDPDSAEMSQGVSLSATSVTACSTHPSIEEYFSALDDQGLGVILESVLNEARSLEIPVNLAIIRELKASETPASFQNKPLEIQKSPARLWLHQVCEDLSETHDSCEFSKLISIRSGELLYIQGGGDRLNLMPWIRGVLAESLPLLSGEAVKVGDEGESVSNGLVAGLASVGRPNKSFRSTALLQAALRCLEAAKRQGTGAIKSIEVF